MKKLITFLTFTCLPILSSNAAESNFSTGVIDYGIVVKIKADRAIVLPRDIILRRVLPPLIKGRVMVGAKHLVVEPQTEARAAESVRPDFCVFAMAADLRVMPLFR